MASPSKFGDLHSFALFHAHFFSSLTSNSSTFLANLKTMYFVHSFLVAIAACSVVSVGAWKPEGEDETITVTQTRTHTICPCATTSVRRLNPVGPGSSGWRDWESGSVTSKSTTNWAHTSKTPVASTTKSTTTSRGNHGESTGHWGSTTSLSPSPSTKSSTSSGSTSVSTVSSTWTTHTYSTTSTTASSPTTTSSDTSSTSSPPTSTTTTSTAETTTSTPSTTSSASLTTTTTITTTTTTTTTTTSPANTPCPTGQAFLIQDSSAAAYARFEFVDASIGYLVSFIEDITNADTFIFTVIENECRLSSPNLASAYVSSALDNEGSFVNVHYFYFSTPDVLPTDIDSTPIVCEVDVLNTLSCVVLGTDQNILQSIPNQPSTLAIGNEVFPDSTLGPYTLIPLPI